MDPSISDAAVGDEPQRSSRRLAWLLSLGALAIGGACFAAYSYYRQADAIPKSIPAEEFRVGLNAPFIKTADNIVDKMVAMAEIGEDDVVYDLGCGDGRLVITAALKHGCRGVGFDIEPDRVAEAKANAKLHGVEHLVEIREADVFDVDLSGADVILMYLLPHMTKRLVPQFQEMKAGSRIISHDFGIGDIKYIEPESTSKVWVEKDSEEHLVHRWYVPLDVPPPRADRAKN